MHKSCVQNSKKARSQTEEAPRHTNGRKQAFLYWGQPRIWPRCAQEFNMFCRLLAPKCLFRACAAQNTTNCTPSTKLLQAYFPAIPAGVACKVLRHSWGELCISVLLKRYERYSLPIFTFLNQSSSTIPSYPTRALTIPYYFSAAFTLIPTISPIQVRFACMLSKSSVIVASKATQRLAQTARHINPSPKTTMSSITTATKKHKVTVVGSGNWYVN